MALSQVVKYGDESISYVRKVINKNKYKNILLVRGKQSFIESGGHTLVNEILLDREYTSFQDFENNPKIDDVRKGVDLLRKKKCDCIIAIGGGSVIDIAKLISFYSNKEECSLNNIRAKMNEKDRIPIIAIPSTAGTGSECTHFAVLYDGYDKYSVADQYLKPDIVCLIPKLTYSIGKYLSYVTAFDAFSQAIESFWSINSTKESLKYSTKAMSMIWNNIDSVGDNKNYRIRNALLEASFYAGKAINITKTTAPHAFSYYISQKYNIAHGHAVAITLPFFIQYNYELKKSDCNDKRGYNYVKSNLNILSDILGLKHEEIYNKITKEKFSELYSPNYLEDLLSSENLFKEWPAHVNMERLANNPRKVDEAVWPQLKKYFRSLIE
jgi:alcohol dehydrogenase class IV